jgi:cob(I)alamin adenosyltransferase
MKIYTRTGDSGTTSIIGGTRLPKDDARIEAYGTVDELNSHIGLMAAMPHFPADINPTVDFVQSKLFDIGAYLAGAESPMVSDENISRLEQNIDLMNLSIPPITQFTLPGGCLAAGQAHVARTVARRAERRILSAGLTDPQAMAFINRLSDWLYTLARYCNAIENIPEKFWQKDA